MSNIDSTLKERGSRYGEFVEHAEITQSIKDAMATGRNWPTIDDDMKEALEMVAHKIGRILNGDPDYVDSWTDIIGYTRLVEKRLIAEQVAPQVTTFGVKLPCNDPKCPACHPEENTVSLTAALDAMLSDRAMRGSGTKAFTPDEIAKMASHSRNR